MLLFLGLAYASCPSPFVFEGQPECVELRYADGTTVMNNTCEHAVMVDKSVNTRGVALVSPGETVVLRDLSSFTLGMNGELFRAVAEITPECVELLTPEPEVEGKVYVKAD